LHEIIQIVPFKFSFIQTFRFPVPIMCFKIIICNVTIEKKPLIKFLFVFSKLNIPAYDWYWLCRWVAYLLCGDSLSNEKYIVALSLANYQNEASEILRLCL